MEIIASVNLAAQIGVIWFARNRTANPQHRRILLTVAVASLAVSAAAVAVAMLFDQRDGALVATTEAAAVGVWLLYAAGGAAMVGAVVAVLRSGPQRFAWRQRRYARYARDWKNYRRI